MIVVLSTVHSIIGLFAAFFDAAGERLGLFRSEEFLYPINDILAGNRSSQRDFVCLSDWRNAFISRKLFQKLFRIQYAGRHNPRLRCLHGAVKRCGWRVVGQLNSSTLISSKRL